MNRIDWASLLQAEKVDQPIVVKALTYLRFWDSACRAVHVSCDDGHDYVVKGPRSGDLRSTIKWSGE